MSTIVLLPVHHWLYHVANCCLAISYLCTHILLLRLLLFTASICFMIWGSLILSISVDTVVYNSIFALINGIQAGTLLYQMCPTKKFLPQYEAVYQHFFVGAHKQHQLTRWEYHTLIHHGHCLIGTLKAGETFTQPHTMSHCLTLLIQGKMDVQRADKEVFYSVDTIDTFEFIDSPEYMSRNTQRGSLFDVKIVAMHDCEYLQWQYDSLNEMFIKNRKIENVMISLLGVDIATKLFHSACKVSRH